MSKTCNACGLDKPLAEYHRDSSSGDGRYTICRVCKCARKRTSDATRRPELRQRSRAYSRENKVRLTRYARDYGKNRRRLDRNFRVRQSLRAGLTGTVSRRSVQESILALTGASSLIGLMLHFQNQFQPGMSWFNYGRGGWEIDHRVPLCKFDLTIEDQKHEAFSIENLRPRWWYENRGLNRYKKEEI